MTRRFSPEPRAAATLILLRREPEAVEVLMVKRHPGNLFVPECYVFPGGAIDNEDLSPEMEGLCTSLGRQAAHRIMPDMPSAEMALAAWIAAIRETFEETGILLAYDPSGRILSATTPAAKDRLARCRGLLLEGRISFQSFLQQEGLSIATDGLQYFSHWITPIGSPIRYNVRFLIALAPSGQEALHDPHELTEHVWISPERALQLYGSNHFDMVLPTAMTLRELSRFKTIEEILRYSAGKHVPSILTKLKKIRGQFVEVMPDGTPSLLST